MVTCGFMDVPFRHASFMRRGMNLEAGFVIHLVGAFASMMWPLKHRLVSCIRKLMWAWVLHDPASALVKRSRFSKTIVRHVLDSPCVTGCVEEECYLVDPASSHMLVSKIKPCMCKYEQIQTVKLRMAH